MYKQVLLLMALREAAQPPSDNGQPSTRASDLLADFNRLRREPSLIYSLVLEEIDDSLTTAKLQAVLLTLDKRYGCIEPEYHYSGRYILTPVESLNQRGERAKLPLVEQSMILNILYPTII